MRYARIQDGRIVELGYFDSIENRFHPSLVWVECPDEQFIEGDTFDGQVFSKALLPPPPSPEQLREAAKAARAAAVSAITVTTQAGNTFDGDETSQGRMVRAIVALQATGTPSVNWVLADNSVIAASAAELSEALALAGAAQAAIWVLP